jgi:hypothetical protein
MHFRASCRSIRGGSIATDHPRPVEASMTIPPKPIDAAYSKRYRIRLSGGPPHIVVPEVPRRSGSTPPRHFGRKKTRRLRITPSFRTKRKRGAPISPRRSGRKENEAPPYHPVVPDAAKRRSGIQRLHNPAPAALQSISTSGDQRHWAPDQVRGDGKGSKPTAASGKVRQQKSDGDSRFADSAPRNDGYGGRCPIHKMPGPPTRRPGMTGLWRQAPDSLHTPPSFRGRE